MLGRFHTSHGGLPHVIPPCRPETQRPWSVHLDRSKKHVSENVCDLMKQAEVHTERRTAGVYPKETRHKSHEAAGLLSSHVTATRTGLSAASDYVLTKHRDLQRTPIPLDARNIEFRKLSVDFQKRV